MEFNYAKYIRIMGIVQIICIVLKCIGITNWPWGVMIIPGWIMFVLFIVGFVSFCSRP